MEVSSEQAVQILSIMFLWVMFLSAIRFSLSTVYALHPLMHAGVRAMKWRMNRHDRMREIVGALDAIQMRFQIALCTPWAIPLLFAGLGLIGIAISLTSSGDVMVLVAREPQRWIASDYYMDWAGSMTGGLGMAATLAALSRRRTISFLISTAFAITGLGIGIIAAVYL